MLESCSKIEHYFAWNGCVMEKELEVLQQIQDNEYITQRDLAQVTGMSLGTINILLKKMITTGLIKIEKLNPQKIKYILTPEGMAEKAAKTYQYIVKSYNNISKMQKAIISIIEEQKDKGIKAIYFFGDDDEVYKIIQLVLNQTSIKIKHKRINNIKDISKSKLAIVLVWNTENEQILNKNNINNINILKYI